MPELKLYHCAGARSLRALWTLKEMKTVPYTLVTLPFPPRAFAKEYMKVNPLGTVPFLQHGDTKMTESCAIPLYVVQQHDPKSSLIVRPGEDEYGSFLNYLFQSDATLTFPQTLALRYQIFEPHRGFQEVGDDYRKWFLARLRVIDQELLAKEFLIGKRFTIADICVSYALWLGKRIGADSEYKPQTKAYLERMMERPMFKQSLLEEKKSLEDFKPLSTI